MKGIFQFFLLNQWRKVEKNLRDLIKKRLKLLLLFHPIPSKHEEES